MKLLTPQGNYNPATDRIIVYDNSYYSWLHEKRHQQQRPLLFLGEYLQFLLSPFFLASALLGEYMLAVILLTPSVLIGLICEIDAYLYEIRARWKAVKKVL